MRKKITSLLLVGVMAATLLAGCGSNSKETAKEGEPVKIQFMHSMVEQERQEVIKGIINDFQAANPDIIVEQMPVNEDAYETKITALGSSGKLPEVMELGQDFAKTNAKNEFIDYEAVKEVITTKGEDDFYTAVLDIIKTEDGENYTGVPVQGWVQGIFYHKGMLEEKGMSEPKTWDEILAVSKAFYDKGNKKYGIAIPTADSGFTEQVFSQFALSNGANVFDIDKNVVFNSPQMKETMDFYQELAGYSMPGSNDVTEVKDAFMNGSVPMAVYSTYLLPGAFEAGIMDDIGFTIPENTEKSTFGTVSVLSISSGLEDAKKAAAVKFVNFMMEDKNNISWLHMSPGGAQPVLESIATNPEYLDNEVIKSFESISGKIAETFNHLQVFGSVDGKNFLDMGDVTRKGIISKAINDLTVSNGDSQKLMDDAQTQITNLIK